MQYSSNHNRIRREEGQVKVAVLADSLQSENSAQKLGDDILLLSAIATLITTAFWLIH